ncbi:hypothetical protein MES4922_240017 [Mesorhizobium ventifaucium]|uniref:Uncharacterized protein n=1 Tax=Mesorhizobium ventifaucium TaxID=666020 RepID=A0ABN8JQU7_9HYPH|nr:hypothetical protein MES4922_240017 [Mesorhizobium ventifaucium]
MNVRFYRTPGSRKRTPNLLPPDLVDMDQVNDQAAGTIVCTNLTRNCLVGTKQRLT